MPRFNFQVKKIVFWALIVLIAFVIFFAWLEKTKGKLGNLSGKKFIERLNFPDLKRNFNTPEIQSGFVNLEKLLKYIEQQAGLESNSLENPQ